MGEEIMIQPKVSVVIPIWNTEKYLEKCLNSIVNQTLKDIEIICVNNGSTDSCAEIIERFAKNDDRIKIVTIEHRCLSGARNAGMEIATAPYMTFVDSDDWIEPECYELAVAEFTKDADIDIVCWGANIINMDLPEDAPSVVGGKSYHKIRLVGKKKLTDNVILNSTVCVWNKMYKTEIIRENDVKFPVNVELEDNSFFYTYIVNCGYAYYMDRYFYNYVQRKNSGFERIIAKQSSVVAPHLKNLLFILEYYLEKGILAEKTTFLNNRLINNLKFDYLNTQEENRFYVLELAENIANKLGRSNRIPVVWLQKKKYVNVIQYINQEPVRLFGVKNLELLFREEHKYALNIFGVKISFKTRKGG